MGEIMTNNFKKLFGFFVGYLIVSSLAVVPADAGSHKKKKKESYATKGCDPVQVVIHASYGGGTDTTARMMSVRTRRNLKS